MKQWTRGFTLIELLVVVLIIGILSAIAVPQYQKAVLKSRFSGLMPITRAVTNAQEIYYMEHGSYATDITQLDIKAPSGSASANITVPGTEDSTRFAYVLSTRTDAPGVALVMYQKHSEQFPNAIMCEANDTLNSKATWLCQTALHGTLVESGSLQGSDWTAYLLSEADGKSSFSMCSGKKPDAIETSQSHAKGTAYCDEESGEWKYEWTKKGETFSDGATCDGSTEYACANSLMVGSATTCGGRAENACAYSTFTEGAFCYGYGGNACSNSTFTNGAYCGVGAENGCANSNFSGSGTRCRGDVKNGCINSTFTNGADCYADAKNGCANSMFTEGAKCAGYGENACSNSTFTNGAYCDGPTETGCQGALIQDGGYCEGWSCAYATYSGTGCCRLCPAGSKVPKCNSNKVWDGETYW